MKTKFKLVSDGYTEYAASLAQAAGYLQWTFGDPASSGTFLSFALKRTCSTAGMSHKITCAVMYLSIQVVQE